MYVCLSRFPKEGFETTGNGQIYLTVGDVHMSLFIKSQKYCGSGNFRVFGFSRICDLGPFREN